ncbi:hypothetical protein JX265_008881 [Neoarthrinium moseri]|uniref:Uncharacterized protein n=1 Tax=Neoarthrinium moseri TaxID=1658444 RepID=A0A9P9WHM2_9PEZI|nr:uncharacterized protein JN550_009597 [Neoarthrinium moseri]KAI1848339.1 hypothetical protein JX266_005645 [Neoarthrinium moseri]KAI1863486.1 hypothetical protein JN550_009597 [Neoarthrinium moseri]KAI1863664.1 hypothetical protein JX265_008881 [Neoarthrinium moseri]
MKPIAPTLSIDRPEQCACPECLSPTSPVWTSPRTSVSSNGSSDSTVDQGPNIHRGGRDGSLAQVESPSLNHLGVSLRLGAEAKGVNKENKELERRQQFPR